MGEPSRLQSKAVLTRRNSVFDLRQFLPWLIWDGVLDLEDDWISFTKENGSEMFRKRVDEVEAAFPAIYGGAAFDLTVDGTKYWVKFASGGFSDGSQLKASLKSRGRAKEWRAALEGRSRQRP